MSEETKPVKKKAPAKPKNVTCTAARLLNHNGKHIKVGQEFTCTAKECDRLKKLGAV